MVKTKRQSETKRRRTGKVSAKETAEKSTSGFQSTLLKIPDGVQLFNPKKAGVYRMDIIPYELPKRHFCATKEAGEEHMVAQYYMHRGVGPSDARVVCPLRTAGSPCPICEDIARMSKDPKADEELIKDLRPKKRTLFNVVVMDEEDAGVQVWDVSHHNFAKQLWQEINDADEEDGFEFFADPEEGFTVKVGLAEESMGSNTFLKAGSINFKERKTPLSDEVLEGAHVLDDLLILLDYDAIKKMYLQEDEEEKDEDEPKRGKEDSGKRKRGKAKEEDEEDEDEEDEEDKDEEDEDEEDEDEPPKKSKKKEEPKGKGRTIKSKRKRDKEEEDEEDEEEEEDEPPKKSKKKEEPKGKGKAKKAKDEDEDDDWDDDWDE